MSEESEARNCRKILRDCGISYLRDFLESVKAFPCIWDPKNQYYNHVEYKQSSFGWVEHDMMSAGHAPIDVVALWEELKLEYYKEKVEEALGKTLEPESSWSAASYKSMMKFMNTTEIDTLEQYDIVLKKKGWYDTIYMYEDIETPNTEKNKKVGRTVDMLQEVTRKAQLAIREAQEATKLAQDAAKQAQEAIKPVKMANLTDGLWVRQAQDQQNPGKVPAEVAAIKEDLFSRRIEFVPQATVTPKQPQRNSNSLQKTETTKNMTSKPIPCTEAISETVRPLRKYVPMGQHLADAHQSSWLAPQEQQAAQQMAALYRIQQEVYNKNNMNKNIPNTSITNNLASGSFPTPPSSDILMQMQMAQVQAIQSNMRSLNGIDYNTNKGQSNDFGTKNENTKTIEVQAPANQVEKPNQLVLEAIPIRKRSLSWSDSKVQKDVRNQETPKTQEAKKTTRVNFFRKLSRKPVNPLRLPKTDQIIQKNTNLTSIPVLSSKAVQDAVLTSLETKRQIQVILQDDIDKKLSNVGVQSAALSSLLSALRLGTNNDNLKNNGDTDAPVTSNKDNLSIQAQDLAEQENQEWKRKYEDLKAEHDAYKTAQKEALEDKKRKEHYLAKAIAQQNKLNEDYLKSQAIASSLAPVPGVAAQASEKLQQLQKTDEVTEKTCFPSAPKANSKDNWSSQAHTLVKETLEIQRRLTAKQDQKTKQMQAFLKEAEKTQQLQKTDKFVQKKTNSADSTMTSHNTAAKKEGMSYEFGRQMIKMMQKKRREGRQNNKVAQKQQAVDNSATSENTPSQNELAMELAKQQDDLYRIEEQQKLIKNLQTVTKEAQEPKAVDNSLFDQNTAAQEKGMMKLISEEPHLRLLLSKDESEKRRMAQAMNKAHISEQGQAPSDTSKTTNKDNLSIQAQAKRAEETQRAVEVKKDQKNRIYEELNAKYKAYSAEDEAMMQMLCQEPQFRMLPTQSKKHIEKEAINTAQMSQQKQDIRKIRAEEQQRLLALTERYITPIEHQKIDSKSECTSLDNDTLPKITSETEKLLLSVENRIENTLLRTTPKESTVEKSQKETKNEIDEQDPVKESDDKTLLTDSKDLHWLSDDDEHLSTIQWFKKYELPRPALQDYAQLNKNRIAASTCYRDSRTTGPEVAYRMQAAELNDKYHHQKRDMDLAMIRNMAEDLEKKLNIDDEKKSELPSAIPDFKNRAELNSNKEEQKKTTPERIAEGVSRELKADEAYRKIISSQMKLHKEMQKMNESDDDFAKILMDINVVQNDNSIEEKDELEVAPEAKARAAAWFDGENYNSSEESSEGSSSWSDLESSGEEKDSSDNSSSSESSDSSDSDSFLDESEASDTSSNN